VGPASDVYGLGATLYSLLTGQPPVDGSADELAEMLARVVQGQIPPARRVRPAVPATLESVCRKAMALRLEDRYASPRALADDIEHWLADEPVRGVAEPWGRRLSRWERRHRTLIRVGGLALAAVALVSIASALGVNAARTRAEERRLQAVALSHAADAQKAEANRHRDASDRLSTRLNHVDLHIVQFQKVVGPADERIEVSRRVVSGDAGSQDVPGQALTLADVGRDYLAEHTCELGHLLV